MVNTAPDFNDSTHGALRVVNGNQSNGRSYPSESDKSDDSNESWDSQVTAQSEEIDQLNDEPGFVVKKSGKKRRSKKKITVHKFMKMKKKIKKTFSDLDTTPNAEWNGDRKKYSETNKRVSFSYDSQVEHF